MPSFQPSGASPSSMRRRRSVSCASMPRSILGSLAMARSVPWQGTARGSPDVEEPDRDVAEADLVAVGEDGLADAVAVDDDAVEAAVVEDDDHLAARGDDGVAAGDGQVLEHHVRGGGAAEAHGARADLDHHQLLAVLHRQVAAGGEARN